jgi:hypothetical protein
MKYKKRYTRDDILLALDPNAQLSTSVVARRVGCSKKTAYNLMIDMPEVEKISIDGMCTTWRLRC